MKNHVYSHSSLSRSFRAEDFYKDSRLRDDEVYKNEIIESAITLSRKGVADISLSKTTVKGKSCYSTSLLSERILFRVCASYLKRSFGIYQKNRNKIVDELVNYLKEGSACRIYRLDIKSFYESCDKNKLSKIIEENRSLSFQTKYLVESFLELCKKNTLRGVPRGVEISSILADISMKEIDSTINKNENVIYYARYVDDIIIITTSLEDEQVFVHEIEKEMFSRGYTLNTKKQNILFLEKIDTTATQIAFEFLGYEFNINNPGGKANRCNPRNIEIDISKEKLKKLKLKICKSFYSFNKNNDFGMLIDRLTFLSTNRKLKKNRDPQVLSGIFYNYARINKSETSIRMLDYFVLHNALCVSSRLAKMRPPFTLEQKEKLLKISFINGHKKRVFKEFSANRAHKIGKIWK